LHACPFYSSDGEDERSCILLKALESERLQKAESDQKIHWKTEHIWEEIFGTQTYNARDFIKYTEWKFPGCPIRNQQAQHTVLKERMKYAVISYWVGETGPTQFWLYDTQEEAKEALYRLWEQSYNLALEDENFDAGRSRHDEDSAVVAWKDGLCRYFELCEQSKEETIL